MNILTKLNLWFSVIVASILVLFSITIYVLSSTYRSEEFFDRLESRAITTARLLVTVEEVDENLLRIIEKNSLPALPQEVILVYNKMDSLVYSSSEERQTVVAKEMLMQIREEKSIKQTEGERELVGVLYQGGNDEFVCIASAYDRYGRNKMRNLSTILISGLLVGIFLIVLTGRVFAKQMLSPLANINTQVSKINAGNLAQRIDEGNSRDEIALLAMNFNRMLQRIEMAFEMQKSFVSNASHELRTPLAAMRSQLQVALEKDRSTDEYKNVLNSLMEDANSFSDLTTGLLNLAQSGIKDQNLSLTNVRIDEVLFSAQEELAKRKPNYHFRFDYDTLPENELDLTVKGNEQLLVTAFTNLMDNACKFSPDNTVFISLSSQSDKVEVHFKDNGPGIKEKDLINIFSPFYRGDNVKSLAKGHGIGLTLCKNIIELHNGEITVRPKTRGGHFVVELEIAHQY